MDLDELFDKCKDLQDRDPAFFVKLSMGRSTVEDIKDIIQRMGKVVVKLGDGITLLHIPVGAQFGNLDIVHYLAVERNHPVEVCFASEVPEHELHAHSAPSSR